ncbi:MAG TPA: carboxypeptidase-like regulatory domain-containing protein, partial [Nannocystaceae bacterium]|nr:carboxypeptidase-like regulatory domain-containing protein [Nannocystaceae bacterium]
MSSRVALAVTDDDGRFRLAGLVPGNYRVQARVAGGYGELPSALALGLAERVDDIVIETSEVGSLHARVELAETKEPCRAGAVALMTNGSELAETAAIGPDGEVEFAALVTGTYQPFVLCLAGASREHYPPVVVTGSEEVSATWTVDAGATVRGRVLDHARNPVRGAEVELFGPSATRVAVADDAGAYAIGGIASGTYEITARRGELVTSGGAALTVEATGAAVDLVLSAPARLSGRV